DRVVGHETERPLALAAAVAIDAEIAGDGKDPGGEREAPVVAVQVLAGLQEDLLRQLLRVFPLQREGVSRGANLLARVVHHLAPGLVVPLAAASDEVPFIRQAQLFLTRQDASASGKFMTWEELGAFSGTSGPDRRANLCGATGYRKVPRTSGR